MQTGAGIQVTELVRNRVSLYQKGYSYDCQRRMAVPSEKTTKVTQLETQANEEGLLPKGM